MIVLGGGASCAWRRLRPMRWRFASTRSTLTCTLSPGRTVLSGSATAMSAISLMWIRPLDARLELGKCAKVGDACYRGRYDRADLVALLDTFPRIRQQALTAERHTLVIRVDANDLHRRPPGQPSRPRAGG